MSGWKECPGCHGRGFWYSPDNGQVVTCKHGSDSRDTKNTQEARSAKHINDPEYFLPGYESS